MTGRSDKTFNVNIKRLALLVLPTWLRRPLVCAMIYAGVTPLARMVQELRTFRQTTGYRLRHNGQTCYLRAILNDTFDPLERRIIIEDGWSVSSQGQIIYQREQDLSLSVPSRRAEAAVILNRRGYGGVNGYDFFITVPLSIRDYVDEKRLHAIVDTYKLASKRWSINYK